MFRLEHVTTFQLWKVRAKFGRTSNGHNYDHVARRHGCSWRHEKGLSRVSRWGISPPPSSPSRTLLAVLWSTPVRRPCSRSDNCGSALNDSATNSRFCSRVKCRRSRQGGSCDPPLLTHQQAPNPPTPTTDQQSQHPDQPPHADTASTYPASYAPTEPSTP